MKRLQQAECRAKLTGPAADSAGPTVTPEPITIAAANVGRGTNIETAITEIDQTCRIIHPIAG
jgi:hypothetical protein